MVSDAKSDNIIRVSRMHTPSFYIRASTQFLHGVTGKDGAEKKVFDEIVVSALGAAIPTAAQVTGILEKNGAAKVIKVQTAYTELEFGKRPQIQITVRRVEGYVPPPPRERKGRKGGNDKAKFADGPDCPERLGASKLEKKMNKVRKEGGKRGVEIEGAADMGGLKYFCTKVLEPAGDLDMLVESVKAMNAKSDPSEEERKGGSGKVGKVVWSMADDNNLCICAYVPPEEDELDADEWLNLILEKLEIKKSCTIREDSNGVYAQIQVQNNDEKNVFCLKLRDYVIQHANGILREKHLVPELDDEDEDEMVFGDDDFDM